MTSMKMLTAAAVVVSAMSALAIARAQSGTAPDAPAGSACIQWSKVLTPLAAASVHLRRFDGIVYYTRESDGYRVVATLGSGPGDLPIRFVATLAPEQHLAISVPQDVGHPPIDFAITRTKDALAIGYATPCTAMD